MTCYIPTYSTAFKHETQPGNLSTRHLVRDACKVAIKLQKAVLCCMQAHANHAKCASQDIVRIEVGCKVCLAGARDAFELEAAQAPHLYGHLLFGKGVPSSKGFIPHQASPPPGPYNNSSMLNNKCSTNQLTTTMMNANTKDTVPMLKIILESGSVVSPQNDWLCMMARHCFLIIDRCAVETAACKCASVHELTCHIKGYLKQGLQCCTTLAYQLPVPATSFFTSDVNECCIIITCRQVLYDHCMQMIATDSKT